MTKKDWKCRKGKWCEVMEERLAPEANHFKKGYFHLFVTTNLASPKLERSLVGIVHQKDAKDNGMVLNFCPWCGVDLKKITDYYGATKA
jgi:hypothetical protein